METYDLMMLLDASVTEERRAELISETRKLLETDGGSVLSVDEWGLRKMTFEIDHRKEAVYYLFKFEADPERVAELERKLHIMDDLLRFRVVNQTKTTVTAAQEAPVEEPQEVLE